MDFIVESATVEDKVVTAGRAVGRSRRLHRDEDGDHVPVAAGFGRHEGAAAPEPTGSALADEAASGEAPATDAAAAAHAEQQPS